MHTTPLPSRKPTAQKNTIWMFPSLSFLKEFGMRCVFSNNASRMLGCKTSFSTSLVSKVEPGIVPEFCSISKCKIILRSSMNRSSPIRLTITRPEHFFHTRSSASSNGSLTGKSRFTSMVFSSIFRQSHCLTQGFSFRRNLLVASTHCGSLIFSSRSQMIPKDETGSVTSFLTAIPSMSFDMVSPLCLCFLKKVSLNFKQKQQRPPLEL
ncbi:MAG: hypothetical protein UT30_C0009G0006 [Candidatus Uhrbacteria bacterium GW2011_GWF2_39_13]|uniref:Uncharacterized protein n=1 Tax=Candidatus Uhrbacteria bacterium GW2011_GWF2_39_13 TaxID=1618995 RepID=A0A0G0MV39_9BACT|nr:MAG: hypothetical protein UT30_C0009G0006 [Candidatus Uhrbacteria bacterium GW2011_GWF2_39_13]